MRPVRRFEVTPAIPPALAALPELATQPALELGRRGDPPVRPPLAGLAARRSPTRPRWSAPRRPSASPSWPPTRGIVNDLGAVSRRLQTALKGTTWFGVARRLAAALGRLLLAGVRHQRGAARSTPAASACSPATTSRRRRTSACRSSASACCTPRATSASASTPTAGSRRASPTSRPTRSASSTRASSSPSTSPATHVKVHVWRADVGRIPLYLLDTDVAGNSPDGVAVTDRLYGGDEHHRLRQEIVLGIGGVRAPARARPGARRVPHQRGPRRVPRPGARPRARRPAVCRSTPPSRSSAAAACSRPTRPSRPASTASRGP